jgi:dinuclear metal center YbgI/SA1388 family protein
MTVRLGDVLDLLEGWYPPGTAEGWDAVGLVCGDPDQPVGKVMFAVDPVQTVVDEAVAWGADLLVVHHPLLLTAVHGVPATTPKGRVVHDLLRAGAGLYAAHTNADVAEDGVNASLAGALGLQEPRVLFPAGDGALDKVVTFVPQADAEAVREAITRAGAGSIGDYDSCTFTAPGEGRFRPLDGARPAIGRVGELEVVAEVRVEAVLPRSRRAEVLAALTTAHPYEEPAYDVYELANPPAGRPARGHGRIGPLAGHTTLRGFAEQVAAVLRPTATGVRAAGDPDRVVETVAVVCGAGDSFLDDVLGIEADVYVTSDLRHHRAGEFLEHRGPALVDVAHWAAEWTWLPVVERKLADALRTRGDTVETRVSTTNTDPWTFRVG